MATKNVVSVNGIGVQDEMPGEGNLMHYPPFEDTDDEEPDAFAKIKAYCDSGQASGMLGIYRALPNKREQFICKIAADEFDPEVIKDRFGGGDFIIKAYDERSKIRLKQHLSIEGTPKISDQVREAPLSTTSANMDMSTMLTAMQENTRQMLAGLAQIMKPAEPVNTRASMLEEMRIMREMFAPPPQRGTELDPTSILLKGIELAKSIAPRDGETSGMDVLQEAIRSLAPAFTEVVKRAQLAPPAPRKAAPQLQADGAPPIPEVPTESEDVMLFKYYVNMLNGFADEGRDPSLYAELVADNLPEEKLAEILHNANIIDDLVKINPGIEKNRAWFNELLAELKIVMDLTEPELSNSVGETILDAPTENAISGNGNNGDAQGNIKRV